MKDSDVTVAGGLFDTYITCSKCEETFETQLWADDADYAASNTIGAATEAGWTDGPLCRECSEGKKKPKRKK